MTRKELQRKIKDYINEHPVLNEDLVPAVELYKAAKEIGCEAVHVMCVIRYGRVL